MVAGVLPHVLYKVRIDDESNKKLEDIKGVINQGTRFNLVFYFNHTTLADPLFAGMMAIRANPRGQIVAPMSYSNTEERPENKKTIAMTKIIEACGAKTFRVIQTYQIGNHEYGYDSQTAMKQNMTFVRGLKQISEEERKFPVSLIISPEGHRSETGLLQKGESGIVGAGSILTPTLYVPIGIDFENNLNRGMNLFKRVNLSIGETYLQENSRDRINLDVLMHNLAMALPEIRRGVYAEK
jgi:hypothetical protein